MKLEAARVYDANAGDEAQTHVLIIGVGHYPHGEGGEKPTVAGGSFGQLTSPPKSAAAVADWFIKDFHHPQHPLGTVTMLVSDKTPMVFNAPDGAKTLPEATWENIRACLSDWRDSFQSNIKNMLVFYFCGHGISLGQSGALLLSDFGNDDNIYEPAIDINALCGSLLNANPVKQLFIVDCCRTDADHIYENEKRIGGQALSIAPGGRPAGAPLVRQFLLFPSIEGQKAFGVPGEISVFTSCFLDAVTFAGFNDTTGKYVSTTGLILDAMQRLVACRLPEDKLRKTAPTAVNAVSFEFNHIADPLIARSVVTIDPMVDWPTGEFTASSVDGTGLAQQKRASNSADNYRCCVFEVGYGKWEFSGQPATQPPRIHPVQRTLTGPVAWVELEVTS